MSSVKKILAVFALIVSFALVNGENNVSAQATPVANGIVNIESGTLNVRSTKESNSEIIGALKKAQSVEIYNRDGDVYKIKYNNGVGFVNVKYIKATYYVKDYYGMGYINQNVNYRILPESLATASGIFYKNHKVFLTGTIGSWYQVKINDQYRYIPKSSVSANPTYTTVAKIGTSTNTIKVYKSTDTNSSVLASLSKGNRLSITGEYGSWYRINHGDSVAYILKNNVDIHPGLKTVKVSEFVHVTDNIKLYTAPSKSASFISEGDFTFQISVTSVDGNWIKLTDDNKIFSNQVKTYYILREDAKPKALLGVSKEIKDSSWLNYEHTIYLDSQETSILRTLYERELVMALTGMAIDSISDAAYDKAVKEIVQLDLNTIKQLMANRGLGNVPLIGAIDTLITFAISPKDFVEGFLKYPQAVVYYYLVKADTGRGISMDFSRTGFATGAKSQ